MNIRTLVITGGLSLVVATQAQAFRSTDVESFTDPDYVGYHPTKVVIIVSGADMESRRTLEQHLSAEFAERGVQAFVESDIFPPTRPLEQYDVFAELTSRGIDSALIVTPGDRTAQIEQFGSRSHTNVYANGNTATADTTTVPNVLARSRAEFTATLLDVGADRATTKTVWYAEILTKAGGTLFVGKKGDAKGAVRGIVRGLTEDGHFAVPEQTQRKK